MPEKYEFRYLPVTKSDIDRELYVTCLGRLRYEPGASYPCAGHPRDHNFDWAHGRELGDFAVVLIEKGGGEFEDRSLGRVRWNEGEVLLLPSGVWHRYDRIWPELADTLKRAGVSDYTIFLDAETLTLFAVQKLSADHTADQLPHAEIVRRWWNCMADLMAVEADHTPVCVPLRQVFHLD